MSQFTEQKFHHVNKILSKKSLKQTIQSRAIPWAMVSPKHDYYQSNDTQNHVNIILELTYLEYLIIERTALKPQRQRLAQSHAGHSRTSGSQSVLLPFHPSVLPGCDSKLTASKELQKNTAVCAYPRFLIYSFRNVAWALTLGKYSQVILIYGRLGLVKWNISNGRISAL